MLIWLGEEGLETAFAYRCIRDYAEMRDHSVWKVLESTCRNPLLVVFARGAPDTLRDVVSGIREFQQLLDRPWFGRAWTYQEYRLARKSVVVTGRHGIAGSLSAASSVG